MIYQWNDKLSIEWALSSLRDVFKFWKLSDNVSEMVQITLED